MENNEYKNNGTLEVNEDNILSNVILKLLGIEDFSSIRNSSQIKFIYDFLKDKKIRPFRNVGSHTYNYNSDIEFGIYNVLTSGLKNAITKDKNGLPLTGNVIEWRELYICDGNRIEDYKNKLENTKKKIEESEKNLKMLSQNLEDYKAIVTHMEIHNIQSLDLNEYLAHKNLLEHLE